MTPGSVGDGRVDVVRQGQVDDGERVARRRRAPRPRPASGSTTPVAPVQDDEHVGVGQLVAAASVERRPRGRRTARRGGAALAAVRLATTTSAAPSRRTVATARPAIEPAPTTSDALAGERADVGGRPGRARATTRDGAARSMSVSACDALADAQRLLEQHVEGRADGAALLAEPQRLAGLAEDLALADDHRVEAGGDLEEVGDGAVVVVDVEVRHARPRGPRRRARTSSRETSSTLPWKRSTSA